MVLSDLPVMTRLSDREYNIGAHIENGVATVCIMSKKTGTNEIIVMESFIEVTNKIPECLKAIGVFYNAIVRTEDYTQEVIINHKRMK